MQVCVTYMYRKSSMRTGRPRWRNQHDLPLGEIEAHSRRVTFGSITGRSVICWFGTIDARFMVAVLSSPGVGVCIGPRCPINGHTLDTRETISNHDDEEN